MTAENRLRIHEGQTETPAFEAATGEISKTSPNSGCAAARARAWRVTGLPHSGPPRVALRNLLLALCIAWRHVAICAAIRRIARIIAIVSPGISIQRVKQ
jgi:hypothetical protein